ncbi:protein FAM210A-like [Xylocopa sonorina]|uniref:protein FAM210A-like n=1 Tax=Xylocopa sonorina TaxID=1818115 RepID=UPI00403ACD4E
MDMIFCRGIRLASNLGFSPALTTKSFLETTRIIRCNDPRRWGFKLFEKQPHYRGSSCNYVVLLNRIKAHEVSLRHTFNKNNLVARYSNLAKGDAPKAVPAEKLSLFGRMKKMAKEYWHFYIPVHIVTSIGWCVIFYTVAKNVDIAKLMELLHFSPKYVDLVKNTGAGLWALTWILYKIFTPLRYVVTLGCTTMAIRFHKMGYLRFWPFNKQPRLISKITESNKTATLKTSKTERQEPPQM